MRVEMWVASPEPAVGVFTPARTCPGRLRRHCVIGCADPGQNPSAVRSGSSRVRGRGLGLGRDQRRRVARPGHAARQVAWRAWTRCRTTTTERRDGCGKLQIIRLLCKPICKPDAARQHETGETKPTERDGIWPVRRGHRTRGRLSETSETCVVWLITQRSRVQIPPPLPSPEALSRTEKGPSACGLGTDPRPAMTGRGR